MKRLVLVLALVASAACASISVKQKAVVGLQASETALESAHDIERSLCFVNPATESGGHCTNPLAASFKLTDASHQKAASLFSKAFAGQIKIGVALQAWRAGDPAPSGVAEYQRDVTDILAVAQTLIGEKAAPFIAKAQTAVDEAARIAVIVGVKP